MSSAVPIPNPPVVPPANRTWLPTAARIARWLVTVTCIVFLVTLVDLGAMTRVILSVRVPVFLLAVAAAFADRLLMIAKWYPLLRVQASSVSFGRAMRAYFAAGVASLLIPTPISGDVLRTVALGRRARGVPEVGASIVMERLLGTMASGVVCAIALGLAVFTASGLEFLAPWVLGGIGTTAVCLLLPFNRRISSYLAARTRAWPEARWLRFVRRFGAAYMTYRDDKGMLAFVGLLSVLEQFFPILCLWLLSRAMNASATMSMLIVAVPLTVLVVRLPIAVGSIGVGEGALVYLLSLFGVPPYEALALGLSGTLLNLIVAVPGVFLWTDVVRSAKSEG